MIIHNQGKTILSPPYRPQRPRKPPPRRIHKSHHHDRNHHHNHHRSRTTSLIRNHLLLRLLVVLLHSLFISSLSAGSGIAMISTTSVV
ncbi:hypothetical protein HBI56_238180 [Parastagonospora nodorum]|nr:hypothetical protein HBI48_246800 [Parastagonospora nodorum]KAH6059975.1 hypothetical protein HBI66_198930 [Parastagonospora nodorum]KAH6060077.1 hypothetical protein HBI67_159520 [Parastagonospora nodorum]KAH6193045.1 hypothetical protein HBI15_240450 [Parastagonospora nodorum]KAH6477486.1 hypothetical protein HBI56_238180 [Parastagonospora nodorum]